MLSAARLIAPAARSAVSIFWFSLLLFITLIEIRLRDLSIYAVTFWLFNLVSSFSFVSCTYRSYRLIGLNISNLFPYLSVSYHLTVLPSVGINHYITQLWFQY